MASSRVYEEYDDRTVRVAETCRLGVQAEATAASASVSASVSVGLLVESSRGRRSSSGSAAMRRSNGCANSDDGRVVTNERTIVCAVVRAVVRFVRVGRGADEVLAKVRSGGVRTCVCVFVGVGVCVLASSVVGALRRRADPFIAPLPHQQTHQ